MSKKLWQRRNSHKVKHILKSVNQSTIKLVQGVKCNTKKIMCNYNSKLKDTEKHTHTKGSNNNYKNINMEVSKKGSNFRMC